MERCCWTVTKVHRHFTFRQEMFKKEFEISNQVARENAKTPMEKNFYKFMNNANFGYDCRNNFENRCFTPVVDEIEEMAYIRKHQNVYDSDIKAIGVKEHNKIGSSTQFLTGKILMLAKLSLMSFIYELPELFMFPSSKTKAIYEMYSIDFVYVYQLLTDTDSTSLKFVFFLKRLEQSNV